MILSQAWEVTKLAEEYSVISNFVNLNSIHLEKSS